MDEHTNASTDNQIAASDWENYSKDLVNNKVGPYECLYCEFGTEIRRELVDNQKFSSNTLNFKLQKSSDHTCRSIQWNCHLSAKGRLCSPKSIRTPSSLPLLRSFRDGLI